MQNKQLNGVLQMTSSPKEPKSLFSGFRLWDWLVIWIVSDLGSTGLVSLVTTGLTPAIWILIVAVGGWMLHEWNVRYDIERGIR